jgi:hypothetical protein
MNTAIRNQGCGRARMASSRSDSPDPAKRARRGTHRAEVPRLLLTREEAAWSLGMSLSHFQRHVQPHLPTVRSGQLRQFRPQDLQRWSEECLNVPMGDGGLF